MEAKKWYLSRTLWTNTLMFVGVIIAEFMGDNPLNPELIATIITGVNVVLRVVTKAQITV